jgi:hypothetical protein
LITEDYNRIPAKPVLDSEPNYDHHPVAFDAELKQGRFTDYDVRKAAYRAVLSGACGHTYGHHSIWQRYQTNQKGILVPELGWKEALDVPGAFQMTHLKRLIESRPFLTRIPNNNLVLSSDKELKHLICASRDLDGSYAFAYIPFSDAVITIKMESLTGSRFKAWWYDPLSGIPTEIEEFDRCYTKTFTTPSDGKDWVLVIDNVERKFSPPGQF